MDTKKDTEQMESFDLVAEVETWGGSHKVHSTYAYPFQPQAIIGEVPTAEELLHERYWPMIMEDQLSAIRAVARMTDIHKGLPGIRGRHTRLHREQVKFSEDTNYFYLDLARMAVQAKDAWTVLTRWINNDRTGWVEPQVPSLVEDYPHIANFVSRHDLDYDLETEGFVKTNEGEWEYINEPQLVPMPPSFPRPDEAELAMKFFEENASALNLLYKHSVKFINWNAMQDVLLYERHNSFEKVHGDDETEEHYFLRGELYDPEWWAKPKKDERRFLSRRFESVYRGFRNHLGTESLDDIRKAYEAGLKQVQKVWDYRDVLSCLAEGRHLEALEEDERKTWFAWFANRSEWYDSYLQVEHWLFGQYHAISDLEAAENRKVMLELEDKIEMERSKLIELQVLINRSKRFEKEGGTIITDTPALSAYHDFIKRWGDRLEEEGWVPMLTALDYEATKAMGWTETLKMLNRSWNDDMNEPEKTFTMEWVEKTKAATENDKGRIMGRLAEVERELELWEDRPEFRMWMAVLADEKGQCTRKEIGYQRVSGPPGDAKESAMRNAGKRFVESDTMCLPYPLEPVDNFEEVTLRSALEKELRTRLQKKRVENHHINTVVTQFKEGSFFMDDWKVVQDFCQELDKVGYSFDEIDVYCKDALRDVGMKKATNRSQYDARHVALAFCLNHKMMERVEAGELPKDPEENRFMAEKKARRYANDVIRRLYQDEKST